MTQTEALEMITKLQLAGQEMEAVGQRIDKLKAENKTLKEAAQRQWVGLTDEQIGMAFRKAFSVGNVVFTNGAIDFARAIEAKLKELNT